jgi:membrane-bound lytic murein transglycosylase
VASRPTNLVRDEIKIGEKVYSTSDLTMMQITGKGFVKTTDGKGYRLVTWRK